jgi:tetratricopeptide (TPR) repeat protein
MLSELTLATQANPRNAVYLSELALSYIRLQDVSKARSYAEQALQMNSQDATAHGVLGWIEEDSGRNAEAIQHLQQALSVVPEDPILNLHLSLSYGKMGDILRETFYRARYYRLHLEPERATQEFEEAKSKASPSDPLYPLILRELYEIDQIGV